MDAKRRAAIMMAQMRKACAEPSEYVKYTFKSDVETHIWYVLLSGFSGDEDEYAGGEYLVRIELPADFPFAPPHFYFMTPNGLYEVERKVCIDIGEFHSNNYRATLGVAGFCNQLVSGLIGWRSIGHGISLTHSSVPTKRNYAAASHDWNQSKHSDILKKINQSYIEYSARWQSAKLPSAKIEHA